MAKRAGVTRARKKATPQVSPFQTIPHTLEQAEALFSHIGRIVSTIEGLEQKRDQKIRELNDEIKEVEEKTAKQIASHEAEKQRLSTLLCQFAEDHKQMLFRNRNFATLPGAGKIDYYTYKSGIEITDDEAFCIEAKAMGEETYKKYVRVKEEPNRQALRENPEDAYKFETVVSTGERVTKIRLFPNNSNARVEAVLGSEYGLHWKTRYPEPTS